MTRNGTNRGRKGAGGGRDRRGSGEDRPKPLGRPARSGPRPPRTASGEGTRTARPGAAPRATRKPAAAPPLVAQLPTRAEERAKAIEKAPPLPTGVQILSVEADEAGMRLDRFLSSRFPGLALTHIQRIVRKGEVRVSGHRAKPNDRIEAGVGIRVPPLKLDAPPVRPQSADEADATFIKSLALYEDDDMLVINKPMGLAVQGGPGVQRHVDGLLEALRDRQGQKPRLVHRLDKDTAGCLVVAKTRFAASALAKSFRSRATRKIYWAVVAGVPRVRQGRVSTYLAREEVGETDSRMRIAEHGAEGASHALTYYAVVDNVAQKLAWLSLKPVTGRTHQLRAHAAHIGHPIVGDPKYFDVENWELPGGIQNRLHLLARRIVIPHPRTGQPVDVSAPLPPHMQQSFALLGFDTTRYDPIEEAPER
ncbi:MAG TPA: RluA family pseudouridine synthase [Enterovirga sp.]|nr:RluA family pseudouridine synthase [Enterovirga sp.]